MKWAKCRDALPPRDRKFLFSYSGGVGLGNWGRTYKTVHGHSMPDVYKYCLVLWPSEIVAGESPFQWSEETMVEMDVEWQYMPVEGPE